MSDRVGRKSPLMEAFENAIEASCRVAIAEAFLDASRVAAAFFFAWLASKFAELDGAALLFKHLCFGMLVSMALLFWKLNAKTEKGGEQ